MNVINTFNMPIGFSGPEGGRNQIMVDITVSLQATAIVLHLQLGQFLRDRHCGQPITLIVPVQKHWLSTNGASAVQLFAMLTVLSE